jgi:hypothetical protein
MNNINVINGLISSDLVPAANDVFWQDVTALVAGMEQKPILIITNIIEQGSAEKLQLQKMLDACKLTPDKYNLLMLAQGQQAAWHLLREQLNPKIIFLIGIMPAQLGISALFKLNEPNSFNDRVWLATLPLKDLEQNAELKKQLWVNGMKPVFVDGSPNP